jgi:hypothetical protein
VTDWAKSLIINAILYATSAATAKLAIIFLYRRIFSVEVLFRRCTAVVGILNVCWWLTSVLGVILSCIPMKKFWDPTVEGRCWDSGPFWLTMSIFELLLDVILLCLPLWVVSHLQLRGKRRLGLAGIFLLGGL